VHQKYHSTAISGPVAALGALSTRPNTPTLDGVIYCLNPSHVVYCSWKVNLKVSKFIISKHYAKEIFEIRQSEF